MDHASSLALSQKMYLTLNFEALRQILSFQYTNFRKINCIEMKIIITNCLYVVLIKIDCTYLTNITDPRGFFL